MSTTVCAYLEKLGDRPSWWRVSEARAYFEADVEQQQAHLDLDALLTRSTADGEDLRIVFWADQ